MNNLRKILSILKNNNKSFQDYIETKRVDNLCYIDKLYKEYSKYFLPFFNQADFIVLNSSSLLNVSNYFNHISIYYYNNRNFIHNSKGYHSNHCDFWTTYLSIIKILKFDVSSQKRVVTYINNFKYIPLSILKGCLTIFLKHIDYFTTTNNKSSSLKVIKRVYLFLCSENGLDITNTILYLWLSLFLLSYCNKYINSHININDVNCLLYEHQFEEFYNDILNFIDTKDN